MTTISEVRTVDVAGPGFINITLTDEALYEIISQPQAKPSKAVRYWLNILTPIRLSRYT